MKRDRFGKDLGPLRGKKLWLFDMDGTIYRENELFGGTKELLSAIEARGGRYVFITNNSSRSVADYAKKLHGMGINAAEDSFLTSAQASVAMLKRDYGGALIYAQGTRSFIAELRASGLRITESYDEGVGAILVGFDPELTAEKMRTTCRMLTNLPAVPYFATNPDWVCPVDFGYVPDCGSMCFGYEKATGRRPTFIGKPQPAMIEMAMDKFRRTREETVVLGDRLYTDIASGQNARVDTVLVLSGETGLKELEESDIRPTFTVDSVADLADI